MPRNMSKRRAYPFWAAAVTIAVSVFVVSCNEYDNSGNKIVVREKKIIKFFEKLEGGSNPDYAVVKDGIMGKNQTIIVYGYTDNKAACRDIVELFNESSKDTFVGNYHCEALN